jgi:ABC-type transport system involved in cytochrome bd biosynthesis fused ATPase/permease subunit
LLDEPFAGLDLGTKQAVMRKVKEHLTGKSVLMITHDETESAYFGCEILRI